MITVLSRRSSHRSVAVSGGGGGNPFDAAVLADSPMRFWKLNEASGSPVDSIGGATLTPAGGISYGNASMLTGETAITFDGINGKLTPASGIVLGTTCTIEFMIRPSDGDGYGCIFTQGASAGVFYRGGSSDRKVDLYFSGDHSNTTPFTPDTWAHVVISIASGAGTFYVNGSANGTFASFPGATLNVMGDDPSSETFKGRLSRLAIYSTALSGTRAAAHYAAIA